MWILDWPGPAAGFNIQKDSILIVGWARSGFWVGWVLAIVLVCGFVLGRWVRLGLTAEFLLGRSSDFDCINTLLTIGLVKGE